MGFQLDDKTVDKLILRTEDIMRQDDVEWDEGLLRACEAIQKAYKATELAKEIASLLRDTQLLLDEEDGYVECDDVTVEGKDGDTVTFKINDQWYGIKVTAY